MTYWHMQLHPAGESNDYSAKKIVEETKLIGLGYWKKGEPQIKQFENIMQVGDIVLVRTGGKVEALVEVTGTFEDISNDKLGLDWFQFRRKIKILDIATDKMPKFPYLQGTLKSAKDEKTDSYKYIHNWYTNIAQKEYHIEDLNKDEYKIKSLFIKNYNMFKNFKLSFIGNDNTALPIIVLAGKNGTGKTTLLEYLANYDAPEDDYIEIFSTRTPNNMELWEHDESDIIVDTFKIQKGNLGILEKSKIYKNHIKYMKVEVNNIGDIEQYISDYYIDLAEQHDSFSKALEEVQNSIKKAFIGLNLDFNISRIDYKDKKVFLSKGSSGHEFSAEDLSTGEKTLLSKVLSLFFEKIKNKIILIDEPELSLHPNWQNKVLSIYEKFAIDNNCQIIIATHSPHILGSAKNEYIRVLKVNKTGGIDVIDNSLSYGRDIEWVLEEVMGIAYTREQSFVKKIKECQAFIDNEEYNQAEAAINSLEEIIGSHDSEISNLRNDLFFEKANFEEDN